MDNKSNAINNAKDAAFDSVGFILTGTKAQATKLKSSSLVAARAAVAVRKNVESVVQRFKIYEKQISDIKKALGKGDASAQAQRVRSILSAGGSEYKEKEYEAEEKPGLGATAGKAGAAIKDTAFSLAKLLGFAALLMNPMVQGILKGFINGFLEELGLSTEAIKKAKVVLGIAVGVLGLYFAASAFMNVRRTFLALKELATVLGLFSTAIEQQKSISDAEDELERRKKKPEKPGKTDIPEEDKDRAKKKKPEKPSTKADPVKEAEDRIKKANRAKRLKLSPALKRLKEP